MKLLSAPVASLTLLVNPIIYSMLGTTFVYGAPAGSVEIEAFLKAHNDIRVEKGAEPLIWNETLADFAAEWVDDCVFKHSGGPYGENLSAATSPMTPEKGIKMWIDEQKDYDEKNPVFQKGTGHYTQVVWKATKQLGCALNTCPELKNAFKVRLFEYSF
jgi:pathogenesis-related protein 1